MTWFSPIRPISVAAGHCNPRIRRLGEEGRYPRVRLHDLRHTHANLMMEQGINPKFVSERLGHASAGITLDLYSHVSPGLQAEAAQKFDQALARQSDVEAQAVS